MMDDDMQRDRMKTDLITCIAQSLALEPDTISMESRLIDDLGADSLDFMDIMFQIEDVFQVTLQKEDLNFMLHIGLEREEAMTDVHLSSEALHRLKKWMPALPPDAELRPSDLSHYLTMESLLIVIEEKMAGGVFTSGAKEA